jgi:hypothetical protein
MIKDLVPQKTAAMRVQHAGTGTPPVAFHSTTRQHVLCPVRRGGKQPRAKIKVDAAERAVPTLYPLAAHFPGLINVAVHLLDQGLDGVEAERAAQPCAEVDRRVETVEVKVVTVERVRLHGP